MNVNDVEFSHVSVRYGPHQALEDVCFSIPAGSFWGVIGANGSGKSTLIKTILGLVTPYEGSVMTLGRTPSRLREQRSRIGYVPQYAELDFGFPIQVIDVVAMGLYGKIGLLHRVKKQHRDLALQALEKVELQDFACRQIAELSGGQRQRVLIARALVVDPQLLIFDEPTAALDHSSAEGLYEWLHALHASRGNTIILVSHDIGVVSRYVDTVACLNRKLVAHGRPADVLNTTSLETMYGCGAVMFDHGKVPHLVVSDEGHQHAEGHQH